MTTVARDEETIVSDTIPAAPTDRERRSPASVLARYSGIGVWLAVVLTFAVLIPRTFLTSETVTAIAADQSVTLILALALLPPLAAGQFDLSCAQNLGLSAVVVGVLLTQASLPVPVAVGLTLLVGAVIGLVNGTLVLLGVSSFIVTLGMSSILLALTSVVSDNNFIGPVPADFQQIANGRPAGIPMVAIIAAVLAVLTWYLLERTPMGRRVHAAGANPDAARLSGVHTGRIVLVSFVACGVLSSLAGVLVAAKIGLVSPTVGPPYLLPAFAACFLGSTQVWVGRFNVGGTLVAILLLATGIKGLQLSGGQLWLTDLFNGVALVVAVTIAVVAARRRVHRSAAR